MPVERNSSHYWSIKTIQTEIHRQVREYDMFGIPTYGSEDIPIKLPDNIPPEFSKPVVILKHFPSSIDNLMRSAGINLGQYNPYAEHTIDTHMSVKTPNVVWMHDGTSFINISANDVTKSLPECVHPATFVEVLSLLIIHHAHMSKVLQSYGLIIPGSKLTSRSSDNTPYISTWMNGLGIYPTSASKAFSDCSCMLTAVPELNIPRE